MVKARELVTDYVKAVLTTYASLPNTPNRPSRSDRQLARELYRRGVSLETVRGAFLLAAARRTFRGPEAAPLPAIRSLFYFVHVIEEATEQPPDRDYLEYLATKLGPFMKLGGIPVDSG